MIIEGDLGRLYEDGEAIMHQGEAGDCMYVVQQGKVEITVRGGDEDIVLSVLEAGDVFGEMALFTKRERSATVRASGQARVITIDKRGFMKRVHQDPSLAFRILQKMSGRIQALNDEVSRLRSQASRSAAS